MFSFPDVEKQNKTKTQDKCSEEVQNKVQRGRDYTHWANYDIAVDQSHPLVICHPFYVRISFFSSPIIIVIPLPPVSSPRVVLRHNLISVILLIFLLLDISEHSTRMSTAPLLIFPLTSQSYAPGLLLPSQSATFWSSFFQKSSSSSPDL